MAKLTKKQKEAYSKVDVEKAYSLEEAAALVKEIIFYQVRCFCRFRYPPGCGSS